MTTIEDKTETAAAPPRFEGRRYARMLAVQALYEMDLTGVSRDEAYRHALDEKREGIEWKQPDTEMLAAILKAVTEDRSRIDEILTANLSASWPLPRLEVILRAILRAGVAEILMSAETPVAIIINDYLDIAHSFFAAEQPGMVHAILDKIGKAVRA
jgi:transcription antitermination protein NusB